MTDAPPFLSVFDRARGRINLKRVKFDNLRPGSTIGDFIIIAPDGTAVTDLDSLVADIVANPSAFDLGVCKLRGTCYGHGP